MYVRLALDSCYAREGPRPCGCVQGFSEFTIASVGIIVIFGVGTADLYVLNKFIRDDLVRYYWTVVLNSLGLYGGCVLGESCV